MKQDIIVIGGGIVGLATALKITRQRPDLKLTLLEKETKLAAHQTGNNSGVIHSGLYYKPGSLKALNCRQGYKELIEYCDQESIPYDLCGKIVVAADESEIPNLDTLYERGLENGLKGMEILDEPKLKEYEPNVRGVKGIFVPETGIIDYEVVSNKYGETIKENGGTILLGEQVKNIKTKGDYSIVKTNKGEYETRLVINCAGLHSDKVAKMTQKKVNVKIIPFRGEYYKLKPESKGLIKNLIYPVPNPNFPFLGVHFTRLIGGEFEAGPNAVLAFKREGYTKTSFSLRDTIETFTWPGFIRVAFTFMPVGLGEFWRSFNKSAFTKALQHLVPNVKKSDLLPGGAGIRAQACDRTGGLLDDFSIIEDKLTVNVLNAPSPAATASLAIGSEIAKRALVHF